MNFPEGFYVLDEEWRFIFLNPAVARGARRTTEELLGAVIWKAFPDYDPAARTALERAGETGSAVSVTAHTESGLWREWTAFPVEEGLAVISRDVTEQRRAQTLAEELRFMLNEAQAIGHVGSFEYLADTGSIIWSDEECRIYGIPPGSPAPSYEEMLQKFYHPDDAAVLNETFTKAMQTNSVYDLEHRIVRPDGSVRFVHDRAHPYFDEQGKLVRYVGATLDITERKQAEEELERSRGQLSYLLELGDALLPIEDPVEIEAAAAKVLAERLNADRVFFGEITKEDGVETLVIRRDYHAPGASSLTGRFPFKEFSNTDYDNYRDGRTVWSRNTETDAREPSQREAYRAAGTVAFIGVPLVKRGELVSVLGVLQGRPREWTAEEIRLAEETVDRTWQAVQRGRAEVTLRSNEKTFAELIQRSPFGTYIVDSQFRMAFMNARSQTGAFRNVHPLIGRPFTEVMHTLWPDDVAEDIISHFRHTLETGEPYYAPRFTNPRHDVEVVESYEWELQRLVLPGGQYGVICYYFDSTELRDTEEALRRSEERNRLALDAASLGTWDLDLVTDVAIRSPRHDQIWGYDEPQAEWGLEKAMSRVLPEDRRQIEEAYETAFKTGRLHHENRIVWPDGSIHWIAATGLVRYDPDGRPAGIAGVVADITEGKLAEQGLAQSEEKYRRLFENSYDAIVIYRYVLDDAGEVVDFIFEDVNAATEAATGMAKEELIGKSFAQVFGDKLSARYLPLISLMRKEDQPVRYDDTENYVGQLDKYFVSAYVPLDRERFIASSTDVTKRWRAEEQLKQSDATVHAALASMADAVFVSDAEGRFIEFNDAFVSYHRFKDRGDCSDSIADCANLLDVWFTATGEPAPPEMWAVSRALRGESATGFEYTLRRRETGETWTGSYNFAPIRDERGTVVGSVVTARDVTERKQAEEARRESDANFRSLFGGSPDAIFLAIPGGPIIAANPAACAMFEMTEQELCAAGRPGIEDPDDPAPPAALRERAESGKVRYEAAHVRKSGVRFPSEVTSVLVEGGTRSIVIIRDLTQRKQAEEKLLKQTLITSGVNRILEGALTTATEQGLGAVCLEVAEHLTGSAFGFIGELGLNGQLYDITISNPGWDACQVSSVAGHSGPPTQFKVHGIYGRVLADGRSLFTNDPACHPDSIGLPGGHPPLTSFLGVPLQRDGATIGLVAVGNRDGGYGVEHLEALESLAPSIVEAFSRKRAEESLQESKERYRVLADENERLYRQQLDIAETLQAAFLHIPSELGPVRLGHLYRSATEAARVGGDFYDVFEVKEGKIALLIGDVSGHGIRAARTATLVKDVVHAFIHQTLRTNEVLKRTNALLIEKQMPDYVTLFLGILDTKTGELRYSSAGHPDVLLRRASAEIAHLPARSSPLGIYADALWKPSAVEMQANDLLVLFTDGVIEARHDGELFGEKRLDTLVKSKRVSAERLPQVILDQVLTFSEGLLQDDLAILTVRLTTKPEAAASKKKSFTQQKPLG